MQYTNINVSVSNKIGTIKLNRPKSLNALCGEMTMELVVALRELNENPDTIITVITGEGRFVGAPLPPSYKLCFVFS